TTTKGRATCENARAFVARLARALGFAESSVITAFEDAPHLLIREAALPVNADPLKSDLTSADERARLARLLQAGLDKPAGFVLPLKASYDESDTTLTWETSPWPLRRERLYALSGDSPLGLRLPLASLPDVVPDMQDFDAPVDPFAPHGALTKQKPKARVRG